MQGKNSYELVQPILGELTKDHFVAIGAAPNHNLGGKHTLMIWAQEKEGQKPYGLLGKFKQDLYTTTLQQSCTPATSPQHLLQNIIVAIEGLNNNRSADSARLVQTTNDFFDRPDIMQKMEEYDKTFSRIPTEKEIDTDMDHGDEIAHQNGYTYKLPFGEDYPTE